MKILLALASLLLVSGCQATQSGGDEQERHSPWWSIDFQGPSYMVGLVENSTVEDIQGKLFNNGGAGMVGGDTDKNGPDAARGWHWIGGNIRPITGADLPKRIYIRWQSVVEPKTYKTWVDIPEDARQIMHASTTQPCPQTNRSSFIAQLIIGLAPGGIVQVWVKDSCSKSIKVVRVQAEIEPLGPHLGKANGNYYPQTEASKRYVEKFGIPYDSW